MKQVRKEGRASMRKGMAVLLSLTLAMMMLPTTSLQPPAYAEMTSGKVSALDAAPANTPEGAQPLDMTMHEGLDAEASSESVTGLIIGRDYTLVVDDSAADLNYGLLMWVKTDSMGDFPEGALTGIKEEGAPISGRQNVSRFEKFGIKNEHLVGLGTSIMPVGTYRLLYYAQHNNKLEMFYSRQYFTVEPKQDVSVSVEATDVNGAAVAAFTDMGENNGWGDSAIPKYTLEVPASALTGAYLEAVDSTGAPLATQYTHLPDMKNFDTSSVPGTTKVPILEFNELRYTSISPSESGDEWGGEQTRCELPPGTYRFCFYDADGMRYVSQVFAFGEGVNVIGEASEPLVVTIPQSITSKETLPTSARLITKKDGTEATFWSGAIKGTITNYAFPKGEFDGAELQVILNGEYTAIAKYEGIITRGCTVELSTTGCADFWHVPRVDVLGDNGAVVPATEYKMDITGADGKSWSVPGFLVAQNYSATLKMSDSTNVYAFEEYNEGAGKVFAVNEEGACSVSSLNAKHPSVTVTGSVCNADGSSPLEGARVTASQTLVNGCAYNVSALTDASGVYSLTLWAADSVAAGTQTDYTLSYGNYLRWVGGNFANSNSVQVPTQVNGATLDFNMARRNPSRVDFSWTTRYDAADAATFAYLNYLSQAFTIEGSIDGTRLTSTFSGESDYLSSYYKPAARSAGYELWSDADVGVLVNPSATLGLSMRSEAFYLSDDTPIQLDHDNCARRTFELVPRAGVHVQLTAALNKARGPYVAWWFDADGKYIGASPQVAMVGSGGSRFSFVAPRNESGSYTVAFAPQSAVEPVNLADVSSDGDIPKRSVNLVADRGIDLGSMELAAASARNARYVLQPNSSVSAPEQWASDQELIAVRAHLEADADVQDATITHLEFIANEGGEKYWARTFMTEYVTGDFNGDGQAERKTVGAANLSGAHHTDQAFLEFDEPVRLPLDITVYGKPYGDSDIKLAVTADVTYSKDGRSKASRDDVVGTAEIAKPGATITAPARTASESISVSGVAAAGANVRIFDGDTLVGTATAGKRGTWKADVQLVGCSNEHATMHMVHASAENATAGRSTTDAVDVVHNRNGAALERSGMYLNGVYLDAAESYTWYPYNDIYGREVKLEAEIANPGSLKSEGAIVADAASIKASDLLAQPVVFGVELLNGDVRYYKGTQTAAGSEIFQSETFKVYSPVTSIAVLYENDPSKESFFVDDGGYDAVEVSSAEFQADLEAGSEIDAAKTYDGILGDLKELGASFTWVTDELGGDDAGGLSAPRLVEMHRALKAAERNDVSFTLSGRETASAFAEDLAYVQKRAADAPDTASLTTGIVGRDGEGGYYKVWNFNENRDADADGTFDTDFSLQLVEVHDATALLGEPEAAYSAFASFESTVNAPLPGLDGLRTLEAAGSVSAPGALAAQGWTIPRSWYCSDEDIKRSKAFTEALGNGDFNQALYIYCVNEIPELETYLRNNDWEMMADSLERDLRYSRFTPCWELLSEAEKDKQSKLVDEFNDLVRKCKSKMNNKAGLSIGWGIGCRVVTKAAATKEVGSAVGRFSEGAEKLGESIKATGDAASKVNASSIDADFASLMQQYKLYKFRIKRVETNAGLQSGHTDCTELPQNKISQVTKSHPNIDPSGYLYEAVASNRLEDATVTLFENVAGAKTQVESESSTIVGAKNPLTTDAQGHYEWFVPAGKWLVEASKAGYEKADSQNLPNIPEGEKENIDATNWLVVPPPQTEVNIGMVSNESPYLKSVYAARDGVHLEFSRYMEQSTLTAANFTLKAEDGADVAFTVELLDSEAKPHEASTSYASKVLLKAPLSNTRVVKLAVAADVASYAGAKMGTAYESVLEVKKTFQLSMEGGTADGLASAALPEGAQVQIAANATQAGVTFAGWSAAAGALEDASQAVTTFTMPASSVTVKAAFAGQARGARDVAYDNASTSEETQEPNDPGDDKSGDDKSGDDKSGDDKSGDDKSGDDKPAVDKPAANKPASDMQGGSGSVAIPAVSNLALSNASKGIKITWSADAAASAVSGYEVWRAKGKGAWKCIATVPNASAGSYADKKATAKGACYHYRVRAYRQAGSTAAYGDYSAIGTIYRVNKAAVKSLRPGSKRLTVKMAKKASAYGAKGFQVAYRVKGAHKWRNATSSAQKSVIKKLVRGKRYQVKVRAFKKAGKVKYYGAWSTVKLAKKVK